MNLAPHTDPLKRFRHVVIDGPIGVGKTELAVRIARRLGAELILESPDLNPWFGEFYQKKQPRSLAIELAFLLQRRQQIAEVAQVLADGGNVVRDFSLERSLLFAEVNLDEKQFALFKQMVDELGVMDIAPDLLIGLQASVTTLQARIRKRGRADESRIDYRYLDRVRDGYGRYFHRYNRGAMTLFQVDTINPVDSDPDFQRIVDYVGRSDGGKRYINTHSDT
ncbi:deoxynucleoside kinase [Gammaproteobacteria bacterium]|nr:deoxynucleoside kinase [Gammaproteobacteria bacterium]